MYKMSTFIAALLVFSSLHSSLSDVIINRKEKNSFSTRQVGRSIAQCFGENAIINCFKNKFLETLDKAIASNETWRLSDVLVIEKNSNVSTINEDNFKELEKLSNSRLEQDPWALKMLQLAQTRSLKLQLPSTSLSKWFYKRNKSLNDFKPATSQQLEQEEGRKKKYKDKNMAMMGGMAMLAMVAQMFLGKVILIAGAAFVMAKIALLISAMVSSFRLSEMFPGSLKKETSGSTGASDHVIVTGSGGGHSYDQTSGWHRRIPLENKKFETVAADEHRFTEPFNYYDVAKKDKFKMRNQYQMPPNKN